MMCRGDADKRFGLAFGTVKPAIKIGAIFTLIINEQNASRIGTSLAYLAQNQFKDLRVEVT
jgi:hypothetical protein